MLESIFDKTDGTSLNQIADETHVVSPAVLENWINVETGPGPTRTCQQPQKQDAALAAYTHPGKYELRCSAMTQV